MKAKSLAILLAIYEPNPDWLEELLNSLNRQSYPNLRLYVRDDASPTVKEETVRTLLRNTVTAFPWSYAKNPVNLGSNKTFEQLLRDCSEDYIAFCDQDDVWLPNKLKNSVELLEQSPLSPTLVCTDVAVMNGEGKLIAKDMEHHRKRHRFQRGTGLADELIYRNFVMGCTVTAERERMLSYLPLPQGIVHDHYLAFRAACDGAIDFLQAPQMLYRVYGGNQTGVMTGVCTKEDYYRERIEVFAHRLETFLPYLPKDSKAGSEAAEWLQARIQVCKGEKGARKKLWSLRHCNRSTTLFEVLMMGAPDPIFRFAVKAVRNRKV